MKNKQVDLLVFLIKTESEICPPENLFPVKEKQLLILASRNKATPFLFHFLNCPACKKRLSKKTIKEISQYQKFALIWPLLHQKEKQKLGKFCQSEKIKVLLIKDFSSYQKMKFHQKYLMGTDIDILVKKKDFLKIGSFLKKEGYKLKIHTKLKNSQGEIHYEEKNFSHPQKHIGVDLHSQLAIPHEDEFRFLSWEIIEKVSEEIFQNSSYQKQSRLYIPKMEYFLLSLIIHYSGSDVLKGLRNLFDMIKFAHLYDQQIDWKKFLALTKQLKITNFSCFILLLGSEIFGLPFPQSLREKIQIPFRVRFLIPYWSAEKIALFPPVKKWGEKNKETENIFYENFFIKMLLVDEFFFWRLIRPRVFFFVFKAGLSWLNKAVFPLDRKSLKSKSNQHQFLEAG